MQISVRQLLAPFVGALLGWITARGLAVPPGTQEVLVGLGAGLIGGAVHTIEAWIGPKAAAPVALAAGKADPAKTPPPGGGPGGNLAKALLGALTLGALVHLSACASLGLTPAQGPAQQLAYAESAVTAALNTLSSAIGSGLVSSEEAQALNQDIMVAASSLDTARGLICGTDPKCSSPSSAPAALQGLSAATTVLGQVSSYLACRQAKGATCQLP